MAIRFFSEDVLFKLEKSRSAIKWIKEVSIKENHQIAEITYVFCSDKFLLNLNKQFLNHKTLTDIITFDYSAKDSVSGEIYISIERVEDNATKYGCPFATELHRVMIHGVLHLFGYNDKRPGDIIVMRKKEEAYLSLWDNMFHVKP
jgi:rRNA maturation RNase YbeY